MHTYTIGKLLTAAQVTMAVERLEGYAREWGDYETFGEDAHKVQRVCDSLTAFIQNRQALPASDSLTLEESDAMTLSDAGDVAG